MKYSFKFGDGDTTYNVYTNVRNFNNGVETSYSTHEKFYAPSKGSYTFSNFSSPFFSNSAFPSSARDWQKFGNEINDYVNKSINESFQTYDYGSRNQKKSGGIFN